MTEDRKYAILFAATLLAARKLNELDPDKPSPAKMFTIDKAINYAKQNWTRSTAGGPRKPTD